MSENGEGYIFREVYNISKEDTFYLNVKYDGSIKELKNDHEIKIYNASKNLKIIEKDNDGRFMLVIKQKPIMDYISFDIYLKSEKYLFKELIYDRGGRLRENYVNTIGLRKLTITI